MCVTEKHLRCNSDIYNFISLHYFKLVLEALKIKNISEYIMLI